MKNLPIIFILALPVMVSCGKKSTAKSTVENFLAENLAEGAPSDVRIERLDSTNNLVDSVIAQLHTDIDNSPIYKKGITYAKRPARQRLVWVITSFASGGKTLTNTFYLNRECDEIIAVKP